MMKTKLMIIALLCSMTILISCNSSKNNNRNKPKIEAMLEQVVEISKESNAGSESVSETQLQGDSKVSGFVKNLETGKKLSSFFCDSWLFVYHEDKRCDGSTDGELNNLKKELIDSVITLQVKNNGAGWACDMKEPKTYDLDFNLMSKVADWDRFEIVNYENHENSIVYIVGAGESDYLKLYYNDNDLIIKLEYRSEDPG